MLRETKPGDDLLSHVKMKGVVRRLPLCRFDVFVSGK